MTAHYDHEQTTRHGHDRPTWDDIGEPCPTCGTLCADCRNPAPRSASLQAIFDRNARVVAEQAEAWR